MLSKFHATLGRLLLVAGIAALTALPVGASTNRKSEGLTTDVIWATYSDPRFDFSVEYPADWQVKPRVDRPGYVGEWLCLQEPAINGDREGVQPARVGIGFYLVERDSSQPLDEWSLRYKQSYGSSARDGVHVLRVRQMVVGGQEALREEGVSPLSNYTYLNIPHGKLVWFVVIHSADPGDVAVFDHLVNSLRFGPDSPVTLRQAYGQAFEPMPLERHERVDVADNGSVSTLAISGYRVPVDPPTRRILCGDQNSPLCGGSHTGDDYFAIDIGLPEGTSVKNSAVAYVNATGVDVAYKGTYVEMIDTVQSLIAEYLHLSSINFTNLYNYWPVPQGMEVGLSGNTGSTNPDEPYGYHLHFSVRTRDGQEVNLAGMPDLTLYSTYPDCGYTTCCDGESECECEWGRVY